jgi:hypothetical protein
MNSSQAQLIRSQLGQISDVMASPATGSDAVLWATARILEAADLLLQAYLAGQSPAAGGVAREALLEAVTNCRAATVAATTAIRAPGAARPSPDPHPSPQPSAGPHPAVAQARLD